MRGYFRVAGQAARQASVRSVADNWSTIPSPSASWNDDFGRDYVAGFKRALGSKAAAMIVAETTYENSVPTINSQLAALKTSGANIPFSVTLADKRRRRQRRSSSRIN